MGKERASLKECIENVESSIRRNLVDAELYYKEFSEYPLGIRSEDVALWEKTLTVLKDAKKALRIC